MPVLANVNKEAQRAKAKAFKKTLNVEFDWGKVKLLEVSKNI